MSRFQAMGFHLLSLAVVAAAAALADERQRAQADERQRAQLRLPDLEGREVEPLREPHAKAIVFIFTRSDCPISNRYAPEVRRLAKRFTGRGVVFKLIYPDPDESAEQIRRHVKQYDYDLMALRDVRHALVKLAGASVTPEAAVFTPDGKMVYRGRIDDRFAAFGKMRAAPITRDLEQTLAALLDGKAVARRTTTAIGCFIPELK